MINFAKQNDRALLVQRLNIKKLLKLTAQNPALPIMPEVDSDVVCEDCYGWWLGSFGEPYITEMLTRSDGSLVYKNEGYDELYEEFFGYDADFNENATDEEVKAKVDALPWMKCIVIPIRTPEFRVPTRRE